MPDRRKQCVTGHADHACMVRKNPQNPPVSALIGDSAVTAGGQLEAFLPAGNARGKIGTDVGETDFAGLVQARRRQPSIGGTIGFAGVGDDFFVAIMVFGEDVSLFLSALTAAVDYPLARQVLDALDIPVPSDDELDQVLPAGDLSIFADLGLDEMELGAISADLDLYPEDAVIRIAERLRFGDAVERALDIALGP